MRVCVTFAFSDRTGASRMGYFYIKYLLRLGHQVEAICAPTEAGHESIIDEILALGVPVRVDRAVASLGVGTLGLLSFLRKRDYDWVVTIYFPDTKVLGLLQPLLRYHLAVSLQNEVKFIGGWLQSALKETVFRTISRFYVRLAIATSDVILQSTRKFRVFRQCALVPNGIEFAAGAAESREKWRAMLGLQPGQLAFLNVARIDPQKGQQELVGAFLVHAARHPDHHLFLAGGVTPASASSGPYNDGVLRLLSDSPQQSNVHLLGWRNDIPNLLAAADVVLHPSWWEGFPLAVLEAMNARKPVLVSRTYAVPSGFVEGRHGFAISKPSVPELVAQLERISGLSEAGRSAVGSAARDLVSDRYAIDKLCARLGSVLEAVQRDDEGAVV